MTPKCTASSMPSDDEIKRRRKMLTIQEKVKLLDMIKDGKKMMEVARHYDLNESTICFNPKDEKNICAMASVLFNKKAKRLVTSHNKFIVRTDWLVIWKKARQLYQRYTEDKPQPGPSSAMFMDFTASKGWFEKFQKRYHLKSVILHGEAVSADQPAAEDYVNNTPENMSNSAVDKAVRLVRMLQGGFTNMTCNDMDKLLETHSDPLTDEDLVEMIKSAVEEEQPEVPGGQEEEVGLTVEYLSQVVRTIKVVQDKIGEWEPQIMCALWFWNALDGEIEPNKSLCTHIKRQSQQLPITMFFSHTPKHPLPTPSTPSVEEDDDAPAEDSGPPEDSPTEVIPSEEQ